LKENLISAAYIVAPANIYSLPVTFKIKSRLSGQASWKTEYTYDIYFTKSCSTTLYAPWLSLQSYTLGDEVIDEIILPSFVVGPTEQIGY